jgi:hypothetical protein
MDSSSENLIIAGAVVAVYITAAIVRHFQERTREDQKERGVQKLYEVVKLWADPLGLQVRAEGNSTRIMERMEASPNKDFFRADVALDTGDDSFFVAGKVQEKKIWVYALRAISRKEIDRARSPIQPGGHFTWGLLDNSGPHNQPIPPVEIPVWCMEVQTVSMQHRVTVARKKIQEGDVLDTESQDFESTFDISETQESGVLQLLDPAMMDCIMQSPADAFEFSDQSVVLYRFSRKVTPDMLEQMCQSGLQIAQQVDRNYPKAINI